MVDVFPRRNLPTLAEQWGREVENRVTSLEVSTGVNSQGLAGQNRNTASSLSVIAQQIEAIQSAQQALEGVQATLAEQVEDLAAQTLFLQTQTVGDQKFSTSGGTPPGTPGYTYENYDPAFDCSVTVTTGTSGQLLISTGAAMTAAAGAVGIGYQLLGGALPTFSNSATSGSNGVVGASRTILASLAANTTYTILTRRWHNASISVQWQDCNLTVTRLA